MFKFIYRDDKQSSDQTGLYFLRSTSYYHFVRKTPYITDKVIKLMCLSVKHWYFTDKLQKIEAIAWIFNIKNYIWNIYELFWFAIHDQMAQTL